MTKKIILNVKLVNRREVVLIFIHNGFDLIDDFSCGKIIPYILQLSWQWKFDFTGFFKGKGRYLNFIPSFLDVNVTSFYHQNLYLLRLYYIKLMNTKSYSKIFDFKKENPGGFESFLRLRFAITSIFNNGNNLTSIEYPQFYKINFAMLKMFNYPNSFSAIPALFKKK